MSPPSLARALADGDDASLKRVKGIGAKTASRLVVDLQEAAARLGIGAASAPAPVRDAVVALTSLGFERLEAERLVAQVRREVDDGDSEALVKGALAASRRR
jgi:Holliday junction DNA helicase RuvA